MKPFLALWLMVAALPAQAEELGRITAFLDGEERIWHTIGFEQGDGTVFTATFEQKPYLAELLLQGHPEPRFTSKDVLSVDVQFAGQYAAGDEPSAIEVLYTPNGLAGPLWTSRGALTPSRLDVIELDVWGSVGRLVAVVSGQVCKRPQLFSQTDVSDCMRLSGVIETRLDVK